MLILTLLLRALTYGFAGLEALIDLLEYQPATKSSGGQVNVVASQHGDVVEQQVSRQARAFFRQLFIVKIPASNWQQARRKFHSLGWLLPPPPPLADIRTHQPYPDAEPFDPAAYDSTESWGATWVIPRGPHSNRVIFFLHGGALIANRPKDYAFFLTHLAHLTRARVFAVDYRWAPEHRWPAQLDDSERAYEYLIDPAGQGIPPADVVFAGDSAGGGLVAHLLVMLRDKGVPLPAGAALISPWIDMRCDGDTWNAEMNRRDPMIDAFASKNLVPVLLGRPFQPEDMPAVSRTLHGLPPCLVMVGSEECLLCDSESFTARARNAGVHVELQVWQGMFHVFPILIPFIPEAWRGLAVLASFLASVPRDPTHRARARL